MTASGTGRQVRLNSAAERRPAIGADQPGAITVEVVLAELAAHAGCSSVNLEFNDLTITLA